MSRPTQARLPGALPHPQAIRWAAERAIPATRAEFTLVLTFASLHTPGPPHRPSAQYAPWFKVPLKAARLAVKVITLLAEAERTSRLSFADAVKRLAEEPEGSPLFISKNRDRVERFVVVHGQIFLNQIKTYPTKARARREAGKDARGVGWGWERHLDRGWLKDQGTAACRLQQRG